MNFYEENYINAPSEEEVDAFMKGKSAVTIPAQLHVEVVDGEDDLPIMKVTITARTLEKAGLDVMWEGNDGFLMLVKNS